MQETMIPLSMLDSVCAQPELVQSNALDERARYALWITRHDQGWVITVGKSLATYWLINHDGEYEACYYPADLDIAPVKRTLYTFEAAVQQCKDIGAYGNSDFHALRDLTERLETDEDKQLYQEYFGSDPSSW